MRTISVLGSTGSIGRQTLDVAEFHAFRIAAISGNTNLALLEAQARRFRPELIAVWSEDGAKQLRTALSDLPIRVVSGMDGRTTIFDYWGVKSLQAWANNGKWDGAGLDEEQKELRDFYMKLLNIARTEKAITEGKMYDLEYAQTEGFNKHEQYVYMRHYAGKTGKGETLLMVMNFDDHDVDVRVRIPEEAFTYMRIDQREKVKLTDLLTGRELTVPFCAGKSMTIPMPAWKGAIFKVKAGIPRKVKTTDGIEKK